MTIQNRVLAILISLVLIAGCGKKASDTSQSNPQNPPATDTAPAATPPPNTAEATPPTPPPETKATPEKQPEPAKKAALPESAAPKATPPPPKPIVIPTGTSVVVQLAEAISTKTSEAGTAFAATTAQPVAVGDKVVIPTGTKAQGVVVDSKSPGKFKGEGVLSVKLTKITLAGMTYPITANPVTVTQKGKGGRTAKVIGGSAAGGALIGGIAGGGKGAAIGGLVGAGAGTAGAAMTGNKELALQPEQALSFKLTQPITMKPRTAQTASAEETQPHQ
jgi:hypothetical protein